MHYSLTAKTANGKNMIQIAKVDKKKKNSIFPALLVRILYLSHIFPFPECNHNRNERRDPNRNGQRDGLSVMDIQNLSRTYPRSRSINALRILL